MKSTKLGKTFGGFILGITLVLGIGFIASTTAQAQYRTWDQYERQRQIEIQRQRELERYRRQQQRRNNDWWDRNRDNRGYDNRGYDNYPNYGGSYNFRQTALNAGYNEGVRAGREDRQRGERYEYRDEGAFQSASKDYNSRMGDRGTYAAYFRQAFATGYADGYRGY
ncbi:MAG TPA: hypothetical protein VJT71_01820 [Pyrinomonadaceae bacterium]|nr:hypothetical protein [Pyrinomonadaceae bacterium]